MNCIKTIENNIIKCPECGNRVVKRFVDHPATRKEWGILYICTLCTYFKCENDERFKNELDKN